MARVASSRREPKPVDDVRALATEWLHDKTEAERFEKAAKKGRDLLMTTIENVGYEDPDGHQWLEFDEPIGEVTALQRQRRVSRGYDEEAANEILGNLGLKETCFTMVPVLNEEAVYAALANEELTDADIDMIFPQKISWALQIKKA